MPAAMPYAPTPKPSHITGPYAQPLDETFAEPPPARHGRATHPAALRIVHAGGKLLAATAQPLPFDDPKKLKRTAKD